jgi:Thioredoxin domain
VMLKIKIIGTEDIKQKALLNRVLKALEDMRIDAIIEEITNLDDIVAEGIIQTPALIIRNQVLCQGIIPQVAELKDLIAAFLPDVKKTLNLQP